MTLRRGPAIARLTAPALLLSAAALAAPGSASAVSRAARKTDAGTPAVLKSRQLWATIDVCNPSDQRDTVGIRGSMPGDGQAHDAMYMRFRLQYYDSQTHDWVDLANGAQSEYVAVGSGKSARQGGRSFQLAPTTGKSAFEMRGVVSFQWRRGSKVLLAASRTTTAGHRSLAGADPPSFSAATCSLS